MTRVFVILVAVITWCPAVQAALPQEELLNLVLSQNEAARASLGKIHFRVEYEQTFEGLPAPTDSPEWALKLPRHASGTLDVVQIDDDRRSFLNQTVRQADGQDVKTDARAVINSSYSAMWRVGKIAAQWEHEAPQQISSNAKDALRAFAGPAILDYGFTTSGRPLSALRAVAGNKLVVREEAVATGSRVFRLDLLRDRDGKKDDRISTYVIDPQRGFLITQIQFFRPDGTIERQCDVTPRKIDPSNLFIPGEVVETDQSGIGKATSHLKVVSAEIDPKANKDTFSLEALGLTEETWVARVSRSGKRELFQVRGGKLVPKEVAMAIISDRQRTTLPDKLLEVAPPALAKAKDRDAAPLEGATAPSVSPPASTPPLQQVPSSNGWAWVMATGGATVALLGAWWFHRLRRTNLIRGDGRTVGRPSGN